MLSENKPALQLCARMSFKLVSEIADMFRIDGRSFASTTMTKKVAR